MDRISERIGILLGLRGGEGGIVMAEEYLTDDEQLEAVKHMFKEYAPWIIGGLVLGLGGWYGIQFLQVASERARIAGSRAVRADDFRNASRRSQKSRAIADGLVKDFPSSPYADQAQLAIARMSVEDGHSADAVAPLTQVMDNSKDTELKQIARLRLARVLIDQGKPDDAIKLLAAGTPGSFAGRYHEVRGDALYAKKEIAGAIDGI